MSTSPYTGDVEVGGPADVRELPGLTITKLAVSEMANNAYLLRDTASGEALLIDAAAEPEALRALIGDADLRTVVTTHGHWDHHRALPEVVDGDRRGDRGPRRRRGRSAGARAADRRPRRHGDRRRRRPSRSSTCAGTRRAASPSSGAGPDDAGVHVFTGDSLFPGGVGNTQKDAARFASLIDDVEERLFGDAARRDLGLPGPRQGHDARRRAAAPRRVARARLVTGA